MATPNGYRFKQARKTRIARDLELTRTTEALLADLPDLNRAHRKNMRADADGVALPAAHISSDQLRRANAALVAALSAIVLETMPYSPSRPRSSDSWLPSDLIEDAQQALELATGSRIGENRS